MLGRLTDEQIDEVLSNNILGRIGCSHDGKTYVVPINYIYDGTYIIGRSVTGMKIDMMRKNPEVCFEVDEIKSFTDWKSVIAWGTFEELTDNKLKYEAMDLFVNRTMKFKISETAAPPETTESRLHPRSPGLIKPVIYRILVREKTGRYEVADNSE